MNKKLAAAFLSLNIVVLFCSCNEKDNNGNVVSTSVSESTTISTTTPPTESEPEPLLIFEIGDFEMGKAKSLGNNNSLSLAAMIDCDALSYGNDKISSIDIQKITDDRILLMLDYEQETENPVKKLVSLDRNTYEVKAELDYESNHNLIPIFEDGFVLTNSSENHHEYTIYDFDMNIVGAFESTSYNEYQFTDTNTAYYLSGSDLFRYDVKSGKSQKITDSSEYYVSYFTKASKIEANDIIIMTTIEEDHEQHEAVLNDAGGFKYAIDGIINVVISSLTPDLSHVLHHELSHAIDHYTEEKLEETFDFSEGWNKLNPQDDIWYIEGEAATEEIYDECFINDLDPAGAYYISDYGHTNATEDRATIFAEVMNPDNYLQTDFHKIPFIKAKLNYYAECIRLAFDGSENWGEVPWEKYLE